MIRFISYYLLISIPYTQSSISQSEVLEPACHSTSWNTRPDGAHNKTKIPCFCTNYCLTTEKLAGLKKCPHPLQFVFKQSLEQGVMICPFCAEMDNSVRLCSENAPCFQEEICVFSPDLSKSGRMVLGQCFPKFNSEKIICWEQSSEYPLLRSTLNQRNCITGIHQTPARMLSLSYDDLFNYCKSFEVTAVSNDAQARKSDPTTSNCAIHSLINVSSGSESVCLANGIQCKDNPCCKLDENERSYTCGNV
nr:uncharacterized protein LOC121130238 [Lepeophtheirus salmonis]